MKGAKLRVVHILGELLRGGTERIVYDILSRLDKERYELHVCCTSSPGLDSAREKFAAAGIETAFVPCNKGFRHGGFKDILRLRRYLKEGRYDIAHTHGFTNNLYARTAAVLAGVPVVITHDHNLPGDMWVDYVLWNILETRTWRNIAVSEAVREYRARQCPLFAGKMVTVPNGIGLTCFKPVERSRAASIREELGIPQKGLVVGCVGRLTKWKRHDLFLEAAVIVSAKHQDIRFLLVGEGEEKDSLQELASRLGIDGQVRFTGWQREVERAYQAMDVFVITSTPKEGFGLVSAEAMACEKPIVAVDHPINREVITEECGIFVETAPEAIAQGILSLLRDEERRASMGKQGRKRVEEHFNIEDTVRKVASLYEEAATKRLRIQA